MKKRYWVFLFALFFLILSGCSCEHEWLPSDCVNPQICGKCNSVGTAALGHDWLEATCTAPQVCSRCSATQGEPLAHSYGDWTFGEDQMTKICTACQDEVTTDIDRELQLESLLEGYWYLWWIEHDDGSAHNGAEYLTEGGDRATYLNFGTDRSCQIVMPLITGKYDGKGVWELVEYADLGTEKAFVMNVHTTVPRSEDVNVVLYLDTEGLKQITFIGANFTMWFYQEQQEILDAICTNWIVDGDFVDQSYCFQLRPDHTATCYVEGVFEGTWCVAAFPEDRSMVGFNISYVRNGKEEAFTGDIQLPGPDSGKTGLYLWNFGSYMYFREASDRELKIVQNATDQLVGTWTSVGFGSPTPRLVDPATTDYSVTVAANNKVTLNIADGRTFTGEWWASGCDYGSYMYFFRFTDIADDVICHLKTDTEEPYFALSQKGNETNPLYFKRTD